MLHCVTFLLSGFTIQCYKIFVGTIVGYMAAVNKHCQENKCQEPFDSKDGSNVVVLFRTQKKFEHKPVIRAPF